MKYRLICILLLFIPFAAVMVINGSVKEATETQVMAVAPFLFSLRTFIAAMKNPSKATCQEFALNWICALAAIGLIFVIAIFTATRGVAF